MFRIDSKPSRNFVLEFKTMVVHINSYFYD